MTTPSTPKARLLQRALHSPAALALSQAWVGFWRTTPEERYVPEAVRWGLGQLRASLRHRPAIWCNVTVPSELIYGLGGIPIMPEMAAGFAAAWRGSPALLSRADMAGFPPDLCSFHRCALGLALEGWLPPPAAVVACNLFCDGAKKFLQYASEYFRVPFFLIEVPYRTQGQSLEELARHLEETAAALVESSRGRLSLRYLPLALDLSNKARHACLEAWALRRRRPAPWRGGIALAYAAVFFMAFGSPGGVRFYRTLANSLATSVRAGRGAVPRERYRILWLHFRPFYPNGLMDFLEVEKGAVVVAEEMNHLWWEALDLEHPWVSLAAKLATHPLWGPAEKRIELMRELVRHYEADAVVHYSHWGCRQTTGSVHLLREACRRDGLPFLNLEGDCIDPRNASEGQTRTRLEAFLEGFVRRSV